MATQSHRSHIHRLSSGLLILLMTACGGSLPEYCMDAYLESDGASSGTVLRDAEESIRSPEEIQGIWRDSPHAESGIEDSSNFAPACNRCHDRLHWDPSQTAFLFIGPRQASGKSARVDAAIQDGCRICHPESGESFSGALGWLENAKNQQYSQVLEPGDVCLPCHVGNDTAGHHDLVVKGVHSAFDCTGCHDPHSSAASCTGSGCHPPFTQECEPIPTHDKPHQEVSCSGCHDAGGYSIGWNEAAGVWDTIRPSTYLNSADTAFTSHELAREVDCDRCHAPGNHPWGY